MIPFRSPAGLTFMLLRVATALGAVVSGFALTYSFARTLEPSAFALFVWVGNLGTALWLLDLGFAKVLYVRLREAHLAEGLPRDADLRLEASAVVAAYAALVLLGGLAVLALAGVAGEGRGGTLAMFFVFSALNLPWFTLRNIAAAVDRFVAFESMDAARRALHIGLLLALPLGLPLDVGLAIGNASWAVLLAAAAALAARGGGLASAGPARLARGLAAFIRRGRADLLRSGSFAAFEFWSYNYPPLLVPLVHGMGPAAVAFDAAYKVFRGANLLFSAANDVTVPWQTRAYAAGDRRALLRASLAAAVLSALPALGIGALLLLAGDAFFTLLLGGAAIVPRGLLLALLLLTAANWLQALANSLLVHTGRFRAIARLAMVMALALAVPGLCDLLWGPDLVGFSAGYAVVYALGACSYAALAWHLLLRAARPPAAPTLRAA